MDVNNYNHLQNSDTLGYHSNLYLQKPVSNLTPRVKKCLLFTVKFAVSLDCIIDKAYLSLHFLTGLKKEQLLIKHQDVNSEFVYLIMSVGMRY